MGRATTALKSGPAHLVQNVQKFGLGACQDVGNGTRKGDRVNGWNDSIWKIARVIRSSTETVVSAVVEVMTVCPNVIGKTFSVEAGLHWK